MGPAKLRKYMGASARLLLFRMMKESRHLLRDNRIRTVIVSSFAIKRTGRFF